MSSSKRPLDFTALSEEERAVLEVIATHDARVRFERSSVPPEGRFSGPPEETLAALIQSGWIIQLGKLGSRSIVSHPLEFVFFRVWRVTPESIESEVIR